MNSCRKCGYQYAGGISFCHNCGNPLFEPQGGPYAEQETQTRNGLSEVQTFVSSREEQTMVSPKQGPALSYEKKSYVKPLLIIGGIMVAGLIFAVAGIAALIMMYSPYPKPQPLISQQPKKGEDPPKPQPSFTPPLVPTKQGSFKVDAATEGWQLSDIYTVSEENFQTTVSGTIDLDGLKKGAASKGLSDPKASPRKIYPEFPAGALLMRTRYANGKVSNIAALSANGATGFWQNYPGERGKIEFCINDNAPENNSGQFIVTLKLTGVPDQKK